ncbi:MULTISPECIES: RNA 2',3'-cyclic phosphodiesterase [unclassified Modestobacter]|uniref:RNA 2',3'-cyclic phosphodiesterase n=1 Tax=unclassified Modestobacter TaxID=2643866 RepID=UPI0022AA692C|nr:MULTISPECIES: RNA 2',3'-cyclic phosphodiesterase [unclassified Modestobacter]MCZ2825272.1 RNA 2',3'-cyclic phosphodiesterase [Modestobacter sp. VKM Ac-2981]MCZ2853663.1 RNA 2',3'-cyclic phosphodiesterase [Modestobacter sp. VKM Ac-2982]
MTESAPRPSSAGRLFLAVDPPAAATADLDRALRPLRFAPGAPRWTPTSRWHLTLVFLGEVPAPLLAPLRVAVTPAVAGTPPLSLQLAGAGRFGSRRRPAVCWAGLAGDVPELTALAGRLAAAARSVGLTVEDRPFRAHLTVGRWRPGQPADGDLPERLAGYRGPIWPVPEVVLWRSRLGPEPRYERVAAWPVG